MAGGGAAGGVRFGTPAARWIIAATVLGSGMAFLDGTVVNIALPAIGHGLHAGLAGLQWTIDSYLITLTALMLLGGSLGDLFGRTRIFVLGLGAFGAASALCFLAPNVGVLIAARTAQGVAGAFLVPSSLSIISATFHPDDRARAVGAWSGLGGIASAIGPFLGGWLVDIGSWRYVFLINVPLAAVGVIIASRHVPETREAMAAENRHVDIAGAATATLGLAGVSYAVIQGTNHMTGLDLAVGAAGAACLVAFLAVEARARAPMMPLSLFRSRQFSGANLTTLGVYGGLGAFFFFLVLELQIALRYSALAAGLSLFPVTLIMLLLSARLGALSQRTGPRLPMTVGPLVVAAGFLMLGPIHQGSHYLTAVLPGVVVMAFGLAVTVAPLTAAVLAAVDEDHVGVGSAVNNAVSRLASLLAVAVLPAIVGLGTTSAAALTHSFREAMFISAGLAAAGGLVALATIRKAAPVPATTHPCINEGCKPVALETQRP